MMKGGRDARKKKVWKLGSMDFNTKVGEADRQGFGIVLKLPKEQRKDRGVVIKHIIKNSDVKTANAGGTSDKISLQLLFVRHKKTIGFIHMDVHQEECALWGIRVDEKRRGEGLSKIFVGIWILLCLRLNLRPKALKIDKPLISLVLQSFGFLPTSTKNAMYVIIDKNVSPQCQKLRIWHENGAKLHSRFSLCYLKTQNMELVDELPSNVDEKGNATFAKKKVYTNTGFECPPDLDALKLAAKHVLQTRSAQQGSVGQLHLFGCDEMTGSVALFDMLAAIRPDLPSCLFRHGGFECRYS